ncbi:DNA topoisomerase 3-beta-1 [Ilyodon furcidens]|uniref:DNA topoisomerase n=1 Tax=Ilyodon furcidens TaxID=33524 RepID=A0ABV0VH92_9TELE
MRTVLMVAEKPSLAQSIAKILSKGSCTSRKGLNGACSVHEYSGSFQGQTVRFKMTSVCGHVMSLDFTGGYHHTGSCSFFLLPLMVFCCSKSINFIFFEKKK